MNTFVLSSGETMVYAIHYAEYHRRDDEYFENWYLQNRDHISKLIGPIRSDPILDVGCGFGLLVYALQRLGCSNVSGIDIDASQIEVASLRGLPCERVPLDEIPAYFASRKRLFRVITLFDVLEHIPPRDQIAFATMLRCALIDDGQLIIQTPNASSPIAAHMRYIDHTHTCSFTSDSLRFVLRSAGFDTLTIGESDDEMSAPVHLSQPGHLLRKCIGRLARMIWRATYIGEFGRPGLKIPLSRNLLAIACISSCATAPDHDQTNAKTLGSGSLDTLYH